jgi:DNA polymerase elongation subunit (family B)
MGDNIEFQIIDWTQKDEETDDGILEYKIELYGRLKNNDTIFIQVNNFKPFFYIKVTKHWTYNQTSILLKYLNSKLKKDFKDNIDEDEACIVKKHKFYNFDDGQIYYFLKIPFTTYGAMRSSRWLLQKEIVIYQLGNKPLKFELYESTIEPMIRFMHMSNLSAVGWAKIKNNKYTQLDEKTNMDISIKTSWKNIKKITNLTISPFIIASYDIECTSGDGTFPQATRKSDKIIQIGTTFSRVGEDDCFYKHIVTLGSCDKIEGVDVESYDTEQQVLMAWQDMIKRTNPDIMTGYNIFGFDFSYIHDRAEFLNMTHRFTYISRTKEKTEYKEQSLKSSALGDNTLKYYVPKGRVLVDLMKVIQRDYNLSSYKLDNVSANFIREKIDNMEIIDNKTILTTKSVFGVVEKQYITIGYFDGVIEDKHMEGKKFIIERIVENIETGNHQIIINDIIDLQIMKNADWKIYWCQAKDDVTPQDIFDLQEGDSADRARIAKYCIQDCVLCNKLMAKLQIMVNNIGMANVCHVPLSYLFLRGQSVKIFSLVAKKCRKLNYLIPTLKKLTDAEREEQEQELHCIKMQIDKQKKSMIKTKNVKSVYKNNDSLKIKKAIIETDNTINNLQQKVDDYNDGYEGAIVYPPISGVYYEPIIVLDYASLYPRSMIHRNLSHECFVTKKKFLNLEGYKYHNITFNNSNGSTSTCTFAEKLDGNKGIIPQILQELLDARSESKKLMKKSSGYMKVVYNGLQLAYKVTANSLYGQCGAAIGPIYLKEIAASTTATGREMLELSSKFIEETYSCMVRLALSEDLDKYTTYLDLEFKNTPDYKFAKYESRSGFYSYFKKKNK